MLADISKKKQMPDDIFFQTMNQLFFQTMNQLWITGMPARSKNRQRGAWGQDTGPWIASLGSRLCLHRPLLWPGPTDAIMFPCPDGALNYVSCGCVCLLFNYLQGRDSCFPWLQEKIFCSSWFCHECAGYCFRKHEQQNQKSTTEIPHQCFWLVLAVSNTRCFRIISKNRINPWQIKSKQYLFWLTWSAWYVAVCLCCRCCRRRCCWNLYPADPTRKNICKTPLQEQHRSEMKAASSDRGLLLIQIWIIILFAMLDCVCAWESTKKQKNRVPPECSEYCFQQPQDCHCLKSPQNFNINHVWYSLFN